MSDPISSFEPNLSSYVPSTGGRRRRGAANNGPTNSSSTKAEFENLVFIEQVPRFNPPLNLSANKTHENENHGQIVSRMSSKSSDINETQEENESNYTGMSSMRRRQEESLQDSQTEKDERISRIRGMPNKSKAQKVRDEAQIENLEGDLLQAKDSLKEVSDDKLPTFESDNRLDFRENQIEKIGTNNETKAALSLLKTVDSKWIGALNASREESKIGLKDHESLLNELKNTLTKISKDISTPNDKILSAVERLQISTAASNENMFLLFENERKHLLEQLLFQQNEKQRYVDEITCLKQELRHTKNEMEIEKNKSSRQIEDNEKKVMVEQERLNRVREELTKDVLLLESRLDASRAELSKADFVMQNNRTKQQHLKEEEMRLENLAGELCSFSGSLSKRDEEINYLFQLANEAKDYSANRKESLENDALLIRQASANVQKARYTLAKDRLQLLRERCSTRLFGNTETKKEQVYKQIERIRFIEETAPTNDQSFAAYNIFSTSALSNIKTALDSRTRGVRMI